MADRAEIVVPRQFRAWTLGFDTLVETAAQAAEARMMIATELFFDATQRAVHVVTGALKASGDYSVDVVGGAVVSEVVYGGGGVDYAQHEANRGGSHDYMAIGWEEASQHYEAAMGEVWSDVTSGWR